MLKLFRLLIILIIVYFGLKVVLNYFEKELQVGYVISGEDIDFVIDENGFFDNNDLDIYQYKISLENEFLFQIKTEYDKKTEIIVDIKYYKDDSIECILPIFLDNKIIVDMMCYDNNLVYYNSIKGSNNDLDNYVFGLDYDLNIFSDVSESDNIEGINVYKDNLISDHYIGFTSYKGIYDVSKNFNTTVYDITLFDNDVYNQKLSLFYNNYYIVADYDEKYEFNEFIVIDMINFKTTTIKSKDSISLDSYIQGVVDGVIYLFDKDEKIQYQIDIDDGSVSSSSVINHYVNGEFEIITVNQALEEMLFESVSYELEGYVRIDKVYNEYYLYELDGDSYKVYKKIDGYDNLIYLFSLSDISNIFYVSNYIYFIDGDSLKVYSENLGLKNLVSYSEFEFNKNIKMHVYER